MSRPKVFGTSVQGATHVRAGIECQDSHKKIICDDGTIIMAVADGHGSTACPYSKTGSHIAANVFCQIMKEFHDAYEDKPELLLTYLNREGETKVAQAIDTQWKRRVIRQHMNNKREMPHTEDGRRNESAIYKQYGTTLLGLMLTSTYLFAFQLGDGDICRINSAGLDMVIQPPKILGVETHSLSKADAWNKAITVVRRKDASEPLPSLFLLSTDGFANSHKDEQEFRKTCTEYFEMIKQHGTKAVRENLAGWLAETSEMGCGDDITVLMAYSFGDAAEKKPKAESTTAEAESEAVSNGQWE